jgi:intracellular sulfur oxidation DsrE/DsrF family protein
MRHSVLAAVWLFAAFAGLFTLAPAAQAAEKKVVLQISDGDPEKQTLVLNVANNLLKHYGPDNVKLEIVAFGPGLRLLFADNANKHRIDALAQTGVRFSACQNTMQAMSKQLGYSPALLANAVPVSAGIARILELTEQDYTLVRP